MKKKDINISFFMNFNLEKLPSFCSLCKAIEHDDRSCKRQNPNTQQLGRNVDNEGRKRDSRLALEKLAGRERDTASMKNLNITKENTTSKTNGYGSPGRGA